MKNHARLRAACGAAAPKFTAMAFACMIATPAFANADLPQLDDLAQPVLDDVFDGDYAIVAVGAGYLPDYEGSNDYGVMPGAAVRGSVGGIGFATRGIGLELDIIPNLPGNVEISFGPDIRYRTARSGSVKDDVVDLLPRLDKTVELGFGAGVAVKNVLTPVDSVALSGSTRWDVSGNGAGQSVSAQVSYFTALNPGMGAGLSVGTTWVNGDYADYHYAISPKGSAATGGALPTYDADSGFKDWEVRAYYGLDFDGDFRNGGLGLALALSYERLLSSAADTPLTAIRGDANQYAALIGLGYAF